jgi:hypothetical protein
MAIGKRQAALAGEARGYRAIIFIDLTCVRCGTFRGAIEAEQDQYPCHCCKQSCRAVVIGEGVTRHELPPWQLIDRPLNRWLRATLMQTGEMDETYRPARKRAPVLKRGWRNNPQLRPLWR